MSNDIGVSAEADRATAAEPVVSALRDGIPDALSQFACCISKSGSTIFIECDDGDLANGVFDWLLNTIDVQAIEARSDKTAGLGPQGESAVAKGDAPGNGQ